VKKITKCDFWDCELGKQRSAGFASGFRLRHNYTATRHRAKEDGWRGETDTIEKMEKRIEYDLEYLRQWSLFLDLKIIALTIWNGAWRINAY
jgi:putative colanic acid biosynthesis UDP-glucose lipid carrier transferase